MNYCTERFTRLDYGQFLISSQINYSITHFAEHAKKWSHDTINRYLKGEKITPRFVWEKVQSQIQPSEQGYVIFDDTVLDKNHARQMEIARRQWSGNAGSVIRGIGVVNCLYVNPETDQFWVIDYRIYDPETDGKTKIDHLREMLGNVHHQKRLPFYAVLMDTWYASRPVMRHIERLEKLYYCPIKKNRLVDETGGAAPHQNVEQLCWSAQDQQQGKHVHLKNFPAGHRVKLLKACGLPRPHGLHRNQRRRSGFSGRHARGVCRSVEDRAVSSGGGAGDGHRAVPVPERSYSAWAISGARCW